MTASHIYWHNYVKNHVFNSTLQNAKKLLNLFLTFFMCFQSYISLWISLDTPEMRIKFLWRECHDFLFYTMLYYLIIPPSRECCGEIFLASSAETFVCLAAIPNSYFYQLGWYFCILPILYR